MKSTGSILKGLWPGAHVLINRMQFGEKIRYSVDLILPTGPVQHFSGTDLQKMMGDLREALIAAAPADWLTAQTS